MPLKYYEIIADNISKTGWSLAESQFSISKRERFGLWAHGYGRRLIVRANETPAAFVELERAIHEVTIRQHTPVVAGEPLTRLP